MSSHHRMHVQPRSAPPDAAQGTFCLPDSGVAGATSCGESLVAAVAGLSPRFLCEPDWHDAMPEALQWLGTATGVSRVYVFENHRGERGRLLTSQRFEWCAEGVAPWMDNADLQDLQFSRSPLARWPRLLRRGPGIFERIARMPRREREFLEEKAIRAIAVVPVFSGDAWWGQIGFDDCVRERQWLPAEVDALRAAAGVIGAAIARGEAASALRHLQHEAEAFKEIVNRSPVVAFVWRAEKNWPVDYVSNSIRQFGYAPDDFSSGRVAFSHLVHPDDLARVESEIAAYSRTGREAFEHVYRIVTRGGAVRWVDNRTTVVRDAGGRVLRYQGIVLDVTAREQAKLQVRERVKELTCLHEVLQLQVNPALSVEDILAQAVEHLPPAMLYPEAACARIRFGRRSFRSGNFRATTWKLAHDMRVDSETLGTVEIFYRRKLPEADDGPFLKEEKRLIEEIATGLGLAITRRRAEADRQARALEFRDLLEAANDGLLLLDARGRVREANRAATALLGHPREQLMGRKGVSLVRRDLQHAFADLVAAADTGTALEGSLASRGHGALLVSTMVSRLTYRGSTHYLLSLRDISERKRAELRLARATRALEVLYRSSRSIPGASDEQNLAEAFCRVLVEEGGYRLAWVGYAENDPGKSIRPMASAGFEESYLEKLRLTWADEPRGRGPSGTAIRTGRPVAARDIEHDPEFEPWRADALKRGYRSSFVVPFRVPDDHTVGQIAIYASEADAFDDREAELLRELAANLGHGIATLRARVARQAAAQALEESEERYRSLIEGMNDGIMVTERRNHRIRFVNRRMAEMLGYHIDELTGRKLLEFFQPYEQRKVREQIRLRREGRESRYELDWVKKDGTTLHSLVSVRPRRDNKDRYAGAVGVVSDITRLKEAQRTIADLARFPGESPAPILRVDRSGGILYANAAAKALHPEDGRDGLRCEDADWNRLLKQARGARRSFTRELACGERMYSFRVAPVPRAGYVNVYGFDVTDRNRAEQAVITARNRLEQIFNGVQVYIWDEDLSAVFDELRAIRDRGVTDLRRHLVTDPDAIRRLSAMVRVNDVNDAALELFGLRSRPALARSIDSLFGPEPMDVFIDQLVAIWQGRKRYEGEVELQLPGQRRLVGLLSMPVPHTPSQAAHVPVSVYDITDRKKAEEELEFLARYDMLTGLANRKLFVDRLEQAISRSGRTGEGYAVHFLDLDHFKDINDTRGHMMGDSLLAEVARRLSGMVRSTDIVARFGGDEFAVLQTDLRDPSGAALLASKIIDGTDEPFLLDGHRLNVTTSVGIAVHNDRIVNSETIMSQADMALYRAKAEGRNTFRFHNEEMDAAVRNRVELSTALRHAIDKEELFLVYQPQFDLVTQRMSGTEALVRWKHPENGYLSPTTFIPVAELTGLILPLGRWILRAACRQMRKWLDAGLAPPVVAVNLSGVQFRAPEFETEINDALSEFRIPADRLELELTETVFMETTTAHREVLERLREQGLRIAIDDFGTGYSSLEYLTKFPVDRLKIAQNFVQDVTEDPHNAAIVGATIGLAAELGITVVAEGVETAEQLAFLRARQCNEVQGFYFGKPGSAEEITARLRASRV